MLGSSAANAAAAVTILTSVSTMEFSLLKAGKVLAVEPKAFRVLLLLVRTPQRVLMHNLLFGFSIGK